MLRIRHLAVCLFAAGLLSASSMAFAEDKAMNMSFNQVQQAAIQGDPDAEYALGYMYYYGNGTTRDEKSAMDWISKAAAQGQPEAIKALKLLGQSNNANANSPNNSAPGVTANNSAGNNNPANNAAANNNPADMANAAANSNSIANANTSSAAANPAAIDGNAPATVTATTPSNTAANAAANAASQATEASATTAAASVASATDQAASAEPAHHKRNHQSASHEKSSHGYGLSQQKLLEAPSHYYTVQLLGSYRESDITKFLQRHDLKKESGFYQTSHHNRDWYVLVYGIYHSEEQAKAAIDGLPSSVRKLNPWIKPIGAVKNSIKQAESGNRSAEG